MSAQRVEGSGAAGHYEIDVAARNDARVPCTMKGFPGVSLVDAKGAQLGAPASRIGGEEASVTVPAGGTARARVRVTQAGNLGCRVVPATGLLVYLPGEKQPLQAVIAGVQGCADTTSPLLQVKAFTG